MLTIPSTAAQVPAQDSVSGTATVFGFGEIQVDARSGPSGENPTGRITILTSGDSIAGPVTCLAVNSAPPDSPAGVSAVVNFASDGVVFTFALERGARPFVNDFYINVLVSPCPTDCSWPGRSGLGGFADKFVVVDAHPDLSPPVLTVPSNITDNARNLAGARVTYTATATDNIDASPSVVCTPPSDSPFPIGTTKVTCTATDDTGNKATKTFNVTVRLPATKDECRNGGWRSYGTVFKNQGDCVSFVATKGKNSPSASH